MVGFLRLSIGSSKLNKLASKTIYLQRGEAEAIALFILGDREDEVEVVEKNSKVSS